MEDVKSSEHSFVLSCILSREQTLFEYNVNNISINHNKDDFHPHALLIKTSFSIVKGIRENIKMNFNLSDKKAMAQR